MLSFSSTTSSWAELEELELLELELLELEELELLELELLELEELELLESDWASASAPVWANSYTSTGESR